MLVHQPVVASTGSDPNRKEVVRVMNKYICKAIIAIK